MLAPVARPFRSSGDLELARVLLVHGQLAPRLALQTLLRAGGYSVDVAASAAEAYSKLDENQYELVLSGPETNTPEAGHKLLAYARVKAYRPATALVTSYDESVCAPGQETHLRQVSIETEDVSSLLDKVAELIGMRAQRRARQGRVSAEV